MAKRSVPLGRNALLFGVLMLAAVWLAGCSSTKHPTITVVPQNGGTSFLISGSGFSNGSPCASMGAAFPSLPWVSISHDVGCNGGSFSNYSWTPAPIAGCTASTTVVVIAVDIATYVPTFAQASIAW